MNNLDRKRLLAKASIKRDFGDLFTYLVFPGGMTVTLIYAFIFKNEYGILKDPVIFVMFFGSVTVSTAVTLLWYRTPKFHLLGTVPSKWKTTITRSLRKIGYDLIDSNAHSLSFSKGSKYWFSVITYTRCIVLEDRGMLYACLWKGSTKIERDILYSGKSVARHIKSILYKNNDSDDEPQIVDFKWQNQADNNTKLKMELLHADNSVEKFCVSFKEAVKHVLSIPWGAELSQAESLNQVSPTVSIEYPEKAYVLWASVIHKVDDDFEFLVCLEQKKMNGGKKKLSGAKENYIEVAQADQISISILPELFHMFYTGQFEILAKKIEER